MPQAGLPLAFKVQHYIDQVLQHARPGNVAVFGDVADQQNRNTGGFRQRGQRGRDRAGLRHATRNPLHAGGLHSLHGIDNDQRWS